MIPVLKGTWELERHWRRFALDFIDQGWGRRWINAYCIVCNSRKSSPMKNRAHLQLSFAADRPLQRIPMDIIGPLPVTPWGNWYILVIGDCFTKWNEAFHLAYIESSSIARVVVNECICRFCIPDTIHTNQGWNFESGLIRNICQLLGVKKIRTNPYRPESDGLVEHFNTTLMDKLSLAVRIMSGMGFTPSNIAASIPDKQAWNCRDHSILSYVNLWKRPMATRRRVYSPPVDSHTSAHRYCRELKRQ